jgi:hypothetical protein
MAAFEDTLEDESLLGRSLRPGAQLVLSGVLRAGNERVYIGRDGWLFYRPDTEYVTSAAFSSRHGFAAGWRPRASGPRRRSRTRASAILDFHRQLRARGITLVVMPTPVKPSIHPEQFHAAYDAHREPVQNVSYAAARGPHARGRARVRSGEALDAARTSGPQYLATDTHWRPETMEAVANQLAALVRRHVGLPASPLRASA